MRDRSCIFSFFAGSGFLDLGFETSDFNIVYVQEIFSQFMPAYCQLHGVHFLLFTC